MQKYHIHLGAECEAECSAAGEPLMPLKQVDGNEGEYHRDAVIEQPEYEYRVHASRCAHEKHSPRWHAHAAHAHRCRSIGEHNESNKRSVEDAKDGLRFENILSSICHPSERSKNVHKPCRVHKRSCAPRKLR